MKETNFNNFPQLVSYYLEKLPPNNNFLNLKQEDTWENLSIDSFLKQIRYNSLALRKKGVRAKNFVGLIAPSSPIWVVMDQAIISNGSVTLPMFTNISQFNLAYQVKETGLKFVFISGLKSLETISSVIKKLKLIIYHDIEKRKIPKAHIKKFISYQEFSQLGKQELAKKDTFEANLKKIKKDDLATLVYTSGTTADPKGVMITHKNLIHQMIGVRERFPLDPLNDSALSCLPLAHIFERAVIYLHLTFGISIYFCPNLTKIGETIREIKPSIITVVPRILEKVYEKMSNSSKNFSGIKRILVESAIKRAQTKNPSEKPTLIDQIFLKMVYKKFQQALGDRIRIIVSGGAALHPTVYRFFKNAGINVAEGYGLTETSPVISANDFTSNTPFTVGRLLSGVEVKIQKDGEIWTKSPSIMKGYYKKEKATSAVLNKQGWFKTGDLGRFDGINLVIQGRKKDFFKLQNGKYVIPVPIEQAIERNELVETAFVVGDGKKFVSLLLFMDLDKKAELEDQAEAIIKQAIGQLNQQLQDWERVVKFKLIWKRLSIEEGEITPKMNIRRNALLEKYQQEIAAFYQ